MYSVFLADSFSTNESGLYGRVIANRRLLSSLLSCGEVNRVYTTAPLTLFSSLASPEVIQAKMTQLISLDEVNRVFTEQQIRAVLCSDFISHYADWIHYRNTRGFATAVVGFTHSLSYQRFTADIYRILCANPAPQDGILCTSRCAVEVLERLFARVAATMKLPAHAPEFIRFPLPFASTITPVATEKSKTTIQVLYVGRLDWQTKADILVLKHSIVHVPQELGCRFVVAGPADNETYLELLRQELEPLGVRLVVSPSEEDKIQLYQESHIFFSPSDNYQETFGLTVIEAMNYGCIPVVTDFDGYRDLVAEGANGFRIKTVAAHIPPTLFSSQSVVSEATYHGWWASGVAFDPREAARLIETLARDEALRIRMSRAAREAVSEYSVEKTSARFATLFAERGAKMGKPPAASNHNPFEWNFSELFATHPTEQWKNQSVAITAEGVEYLSHPYRMPQLALLSQAVEMSDVRKFLFLIQRGHSVEECLFREVEPIVMSVALKNGLITLSPKQSPHR